MRLYTCSHYMLSSIQQTIQGGHAAVELFVKYKNDNQKMNAIMDWATNHKTWIATSGGNSAGLYGIIDALKESTLPWTTFYEDVQSLQGALTSIAIIVPTEYCDFMDNIRHNKHSTTSLDILVPPSLSNLDEDILNILISLPLAK